jgi:hypothetical protein
VDQLTKMNCKVLNKEWDHGSFQLKEGWTTHIEPYEFEKKKNFSFKGCGWFGCLISKPMKQGLVLKKNGLSHHISKKIWEQHVVHCHEQP